MGRLLMAAVLAMMVLVLLYGLNYNLPEGGSEYLREPGLSVVTQLTSGSGMDEMTMLVVATVVNLIVYTLVLFILFTLIAKVRQPKRSFR